MLARINTNSLKVGKWDVFHGYLRGKRDGEIVPTAKKAAGQNTNCTMIRDDRENTECHVLDVPCMMYALSGAD